MVYLGHVRSEQGIQAVKALIEGDKNWQVRKNVKEVRQFLDFTRYYSMFVKWFAEKARLLNDLLVGLYTNPQTRKKLKEIKKPLLFEWKEEHQHSFQTLIEKFTTPPVLAYADCRLPFSVHTNAYRMVLVQFRIRNKTTTRTHSMARHRKSPRSRGYLMVFDPLTPSQGHQFHPRVKISVHPGLLLIPFNLICHRTMFRKLNYWPPAPTIPKPWGMNDQGDRLKMPSNMFYIFYLWEDTQSLVKKSLKLTL